MSSKITVLNTTQSHLQSHVQTLEANLGSNSKLLEQFRKDSASSQSDIEKLQINNKALEREKANLLGERVSLKDQIVALTKSNADAEEKARQLESEAQYLKGQKVRFDYLFIAQYLK